MSVLSSLWRRVSTAYRSSKVAGKTVSKASWFHRFTQSGTARALGRGLGAAGLVLDGYLLYDWMTSSDETGPLRSLALIAGICDNAVKSLLLHESIYDQDSIRQVCYVSAAAYSGEFASEADSYKAAARAVLPSYLAEVPYGATMYDVEARSTILKGLVTSSIAENIIVEGQEEHEKVTDADIKAMVSSMHENDDTPYDVTRIYDFICYVLVCLSEDADPSTITDIEAASKIDGLAVNPTLQEAIEPVDQDLNALPNNAPAAAGSPGSSVSPAQNNGL